MKFINAIMILGLLITNGRLFSQTTLPDSLKEVLQSASTDSARFVISGELGFYFREVNFDTAIYYDNIAIKLAEKNNQLLDLATLLDEKGYVLMKSGKYAESLKSTQEAIHILEEINSEQNIWTYFPTVKNPTTQNLKGALLAVCHHHLGHLMGRARNLKQQIFHYNETLNLINNLGEAQSLAGFANMNLGNAYLKLDNLDSARVFLEKAYKIFKEEGEERYLANVFLLQGQTHIKKGNVQIGLQNLHNGKRQALKANNLTSLSDAYTFLSEYYLQENQKDSCLFYSRKNLDLLQSMESKDIGHAFTLLYRSFRLNENIDSAYKYQGLALAANEEEFNSEMTSISEFQILSFEESQRLERLEREKANIRNRIRTIGLLSVLSVVTIIGFILFRNNRQKKRTNSMLKDTLHNLQTTQAQLIQAEKMASLGELTAGIAHEIQNPLNFVNNFSEVSAEMVEELDEELKKNDINEAQIISKDLKQNLAKINHHGKRAESIVKAMLLHSRSTKGEKVPTDINALCDEFLRLSYHGLRAKDRSFNAEFEMNLDPDLPKLEVVPQDIGRVLLNLFNNAFQACSEAASADRSVSANDDSPTSKLNSEDTSADRSVSAATIEEITPFQNKSSLSGQNPLTGLEEETDGKEPVGSPEESKLSGTALSGVVKVLTKNLGDKIEITVTDNGPGIPDNIKDKIFQPFFTTKPTGQGTGLGLSLTYDIVKAHGGSISFQTQPGKETSFHIELPINH